MKDKQCSLSFVTVTVEEVESLLSSLSEDVSPGTDNMDVRLLKIAARYISPAICHIVNRCLISGVFPSQWKESKIRNKSVSAENSTPISSLPVLSHILEKILHEQIQEYFKDNQLLTQSQHAYRPGYSTTSALVHMTDDWYKELDERKLVGVVFMDFIAAFDVSHDLLVDKLKCYGLSDLALSLIRTYLSGRRQKVYYNGCFSNFRDVDCGVPQGSVLGRLLFSIFVNDLPLVLGKSSIVMYADHMTVYHSAGDCNDLTSVLGAELEAVHDWVTDNKMILNIPNSKSMIIRGSRRWAPDPQLRLSIQGIKLDQVKQIRFLGITLDQRLSCSLHINNIVKKMNEGITISKMCSTVVSQENMRSVVESLVLSHLDYCSVIWSTANKTHLKKLQVFKKKAARIVHRCEPATGVN